MSDELLLEVISDPADSTADAIGRFERIDHVLPSNDGLKWFNLLYAMVVREVGGHQPPGGWNDPAWLERLNVNFVNLYFDALRSHIQAPMTTPKPWRILFAARSEARIMRVQFALCGMNAHINRDLQFALVRTFEETGVEPERDSPQYLDFDHVNEILEIVEPQALALLSTGLIDVVTESLGRLDDVIAMWKVRRARETAWFNSELSWGLRHTMFLRRKHNDIVENLASLAGRGLIVRL